jgi:histidyl-tRNA synthetase
MIDILSILSPSPGGRMSDIIAPKVLKGFRDYLPTAEIARAGLMRRLEMVFRSFGFVPIDTPALEYAEILLGKGGGETDKQVYRFTDNGGREVALRFDLTVPFARFMAEHVDELYLPFRRYHMAKVWRGENTQRGRYREFVQCDFDIVGVDSASADADVLLTIAAAMRALDVGDVRIRVNHRGIFNRFLARENLSEKSVAILRTVDKLEKLGMEQTRALLEEETGTEAAKKILSFIEPEADFPLAVEKIHGFCDPGDVMAAMARDRLMEVWEIAKNANLSSSLVLDPSITRGLDYYTGIVVETSLVDFPQIGSVCSGGRYNELASLYTTRKLPGVGASIGMDRLLAALEELGRSANGSETAGVLVANNDGSEESTLHEVAARLRECSISTEVYPEKKKLLSQYQYAEKKGLPFVVVAGKGPEGENGFSVREISSRSTREFDSLAKLCDYFLEIFHPTSK